MDVKPYFLDDSCKIPEYIKQMSREERQREIRRLEEEARQKRRQKQKAAIWRLYDTTKHGV